MDEVCHVHIVIIIIIMEYAYYFPQQKYLLLVSL